jgi:capsular exopolysaccharide synthesis family protein
MSNQDQSYIQEGPAKSIDLTKIAIIILSRWYVIATTLLLSFTIAYIQLRYTKPLYKATTSLKFEDERGGQVSDLFKYGRISGRIENIMKTEAEVLKSRRMSKNTLAYLGLTTTAYRQGNFITSRLYPNKTFKVQFIRLDSADIGATFLINVHDSKTYTIHEGKQRLKHNFGDTILFGRSYLTIQGGADEDIVPFKDKPIRVEVNNFEELGGAAAGGLDVDLEKNTNIMILSYTSDIADFATDYVNAVAQVYIQESVNAKTTAAQQTIDYIDEQMQELAKRVSSSQKDLANFKSGYKGMEPQELGKAEFEKLLELETTRNILALRKKQLDALAKEVARSSNSPVELLIVEGDDAKALSTLVELLNSLIIERISLSGKYNPESPTMRDNEKKITELKAGINRAIRSIEASLNNSIQNNAKLLEDLNTSLAQLPSKEQDLFNLERTFKINEKIYGYLQEKRLENLIGISSIVSNISIIDEALYNATPIYPKPGKNYMVALLIGLGTGLGYIFLSRLLYNKIPDKETIESLSRIPVIGVIKKIGEDQKTEDYGIYVYKNPKSVFTESIRGIRTNLNFILKGEKNKVICITSSVSGEGKTFCTVNIAASFTQLGHKVVIVGCDLRRPKLHESFGNLDNKIGLTNYLAKHASINEIILPTENENLFVVPAGPTPPNPSELLQTDEFQSFLDELKTRFDFVFLDTAPVSLVSDSLTLMSKSDINLFVIRAQYSKREFAYTPDRLVSDNSVKNMYTILNSYDHSSMVYTSIYRQEYGDYGGAGGYYYYGGYYTRNYTSYYSGYYSDEDKNQPTGWNPFAFLKKIRKRP